MLIVWNIQHQRKNHMALQILPIFPLILCFLAAGIHSRDEHLFDCVDIYKQPALRHPLLKNHKIQIKSNVQSKIMSEDQICPEGMVPIQKPKKHTKNITPSSATVPNQHFATLETKNDRSIYRGASAVVSVHNLPLRGKSSEAKIWIENGPPHELNSIQFGWAIHPELYGDNFTRFTIYWTADGNKKTGCYNTICAGFVQDFSDLYPGKAFEKVSIYGGEQVVNNHSIIQDAETGNWMLMNRGFAVGYWPKEIFTHLQNGANVVRYGGNTIDDSPTGESPPMGNGHFPGNDFSRSSYFQSMKIVDANFRSASIDENKMNVNVDGTKCYGLNYLKDQGPVIGQAFTYGGPGGKSCAP